MNEKMDAAEGLEVDMYAAGDIKTWKGIWERATWPSALVKWR
jgi:hypothetical protein